MTTIEAITREANKYNLNLAVEKLANKVYSGLNEAGIPNFILNDRYITVGTQKYQFIRNRAKGEWTVKEY